VGNAFIVACSQNGREGHKILYDKLQILRSYSDRLVEIELLKKYVMLCDTQKFESRDIIMRIG